MVLNTINSFLNVNMYKYSENFVIYHRNISKININCGSGKDRRYMRYDVERIMTEDELRHFATMEYDANHLPCDGVTIDCTHDNDIAKQCNYEYMVNR